MADEAAVNIVLKMRDEATPQMQKFGQTMQTTTTQSLEMSVGLVAIGGAMTALGSLLNQIDNPMAKTAANFLTIAGGVLQTVVAIKLALPLIAQLTTALLAQAAVRSFLAALSGIGIARVIGAVAITGVAVAGIAAATGAFSQPSRQVIEVRTDSPFLDDAALTRVARKVTESQRTDISRGR